MRCCLNSNCKNLTTAFPMPPTAELNAKTARPKQLDIVLSIGLALVMLTLIGLTGARVFKNYSEPSSKFDWSNRGHSDFHNGAYYPSTAFRDRINPYSMSVMDKYPIMAPSRPCPPITFISHIPFTFLDLPAADVAFFIYNTSLLLILAYFAVVVTRGNFHLTSWLAVCCVLLLSRPGHITLFTGYFTLELVLGTLVALHFASTRPWLSAVGMLIASGKPTFVLPLIVLMIARKNYRSAICGIVLCTVFGLGGLAWLAGEGGFSQVITGITEGQSEFHADETEFPINTWTRVDLLGMTAKTVNWVPGDKASLVGMAFFLIVPCVLINQITDREENKGAAGLTSFIALTTMLIGIYHHSYDCLLIVVPWVGMAFYSRKVIPTLGQRTKLLIAFLLTVPLLNYLSTQTARDLIGFDQRDTVWQLITMVNGICLTAVLVIFLVNAYHLAVTYTVRRDFGN